MFNDFPLFFSGFSIFLLYLTLQFPPKVLGMFPNYNALHLYQKNNEGQSTDVESAKKLELIKKECLKFDSNECNGKKAEEIQTDRGQTLKFGCEWDIEGQKCGPSDETEKALTGEEKEKPRQLLAWPI